MDPVSLHILASKVDLINGIRKKGKKIIEYSGMSLKRSCSFLNDIFFHGKGFKNKKSGSSLLFKNNKDSEKNSKKCQLSSQKMQGFLTKTSTQLKKQNSLRSPFLKYIKVKTNYKSKHNYYKLFLAQELYNPSLKNMSLKESLSFSEFGSEVPMRIPSHKPGAIWVMKFSKDGKYLATGGQDMILRVWMVIGANGTLDNKKKNQKPKTISIDEDYSAYKELPAPVFFPDPVHEYVGHKLDVLDLSWSKNNFLLSSSMDKTVRLWHVSRKECLCCFEHNDFVTSIAFHPLDDRYFLSGSLDCKLRFWNIKEKNILFWNELPELITAVAFSPDGRMAIAGSFNGLCMFYETKGLRYHTQIHIKSSRGKNSKGSKITGIETVSNVPNNTDDIKLLITSNDSRIRIYNMRDKSLEFKLKGNQNTCSQIRATFSDDAKHVICGSEDKQVYIWKLDNDSIIKKNEQSLQHFEVDSNIITVAIFAPIKSKDLLIASGDPIYSSCMNFRQTSNNYNNNISIVSNCQFENFFINKPISEKLGSLNENSEHEHGDIVICADYSGKIKIFRYDCAPVYREMDAISEKSIKKYKLLSLFKKNSTQFSN
ncbi:hypothetical protein T552_00893 [Pneumocystis carinii B80]|uniref:Uncharacterized protein n=1 Tax=Pneumocystis carinii (strain B80) TaxID=1408658 RepID=A0A0W4ZMT3_PNEC8|nr:hypothetical protein T552_00893 [Pneumocystis carinii B80]KTW29685.1 hypothetical protein T552_00893 [Pneumocystis carinii B80]